MRIAKKTNKKGIYLDYASGAPADPSVVRAMQPFWNAEYANPSAIHSMGTRAKHAITIARSSIASILYGHPDEIIFTSGGTESDNLAIIGAVLASKHYVKKPHVVTTNIEHSAVLESCRELERNGVEVTYVPVEANGIVDPAHIKKALKENTVLVSVMYANNEIGTIQPIHEIAKAIRHFKKHKTQNNGPEYFSYPAFHTDAAQAMQYLPVNVEKLGVDLMSFNGSKLYGPKGIGALYKRRHVPLSPIQFGGSQEYGMRAGTEPVGLIAGLEQALAVAEKIKEKEAARLEKIRNYFFEKIEQTFPSAIINGDRIMRLPNNVNVSFPGYESDFLIIELDAYGIMASGKSACKSGDGELSHVIDAIRPGSDATEGSVRFSLGRATRKHDIDFTIKSLKEIFKKQEKWHQARLDK